MGSDIHTYHFYFEDLFKKNIFKNLDVYLEIVPIFMLIIIKTLVFEKSQKKSDKQLKEIYDGLVKNLPENIPWKKEYEIEIFKVISRDTWFKGTTLNRKAINRDFALAKANEEAEKKSADEAKRLADETNKDQQQLFSCLSTDISVRTEDNESKILFLALQVMEGQIDKIVYERLIKDKFDELATRISKLENPGYSCTDALMDCFLLIVAAVPVGFAGGYVGGVLRKYIDNNRSSFRQGIIDAVKEATKKSLSLIPNFYKAYKSTMDQSKTYSVSYDLLNTISFTSKYHKCQVLHRKYTKDKISTLSNQVLTFNERLKDYKNEFIDLLSYDIHTTYHAAVLIPGTFLYFKPHDNPFISFSSLAKIVENIKIIETVQNKSEAEKNILRIKNRIQEFKISTMQYNGKNFAHSFIDFEEFSNVYSTFQYRSEFIKTVYNAELNHKSQFAIYINIVRAKSDNLLCWVIQSSYWDMPGSDVVNKFWYIAHIGVLNEAYALSWFQGAFPSKQPLQIEFLKVLEKGNLEEFNMGSAKQKSIRGVWKKFTTIYDEIKVVFN